MTGIHLIQEVNDLPVLFDIVRGDVQSGGPLPEVLLPPLTGFGGVSDGQESSTLTVLIDGVTRT